jgi:hypothetical protein
MRALLRAEIRKLRWTRSMWGLALAGVLISVVSGTILVVAFKPAEIAGRLSLHGPLRFGISNVGLVVALLGIRVLGDELQHRTLAATLLREPNRVRVLLAKVLVATGLGAVMTVVIYALVVPTTLLAVRVRDLPMVIDAGATLAVFARVLIAMALLGAIGVGLAGAVRNRTVALIAFVLGITFGESIVGGLLKIPRYMPGELVNALVSGGRGAAVAPALAAFILAALAAVAVGAAVAVTGRDIG